MARFFAVLAVFLIAHVIPAMPASRRRLQARLGEGGFIAAYSVLSTLLFAWLIREALLAPYVPLWFAGYWGYWVALIFMPLAALLFGASGLWLWLNIVSAWRTYRHVNALIEQSRQAPSGPLRN